MTKAVCYAMNGPKVRVRNILVIEDERDIADLLKLHLGDLHCRVRHVADGSEGYALAAAGGWDLLILDLVLPGLDGLEICRRLRKRQSYAPVLMLTSKATEIDRILGLETGADDYMTKPFSILELMARVRAIFRRIEALDGNLPQGRPCILESDGLVIDVDQRRVFVGDHEVDLTAREFDLLVHFARHPGHVFNRAQILDQVWGYSHDGYEHTVNSHINRLRAKIEKDPSRPRFIATVWGVGYKFLDH
jgi:DNA-binding response OmpR family regulator